MFLSHVNNSSISDTEMEKKEGPEFRCILSFLEKIIVDNMEVCA